MNKAKGQKTKRINMNINFRNTPSERSATQSYKNFGKVMRKSIRRITFGK